MNVKLGQRSIDRLKGVNPSLVAVFKRACETMPFDVTVLEGLRSYERQQELLKQGATKVSVSRHMSGNALDIAPYPIDWNDLERFQIVAEHMFKAAEELGIVIRWGGTWERSFTKPVKWAKFLDAPHFELPA
ncbi:L-alanyl-D-glutamate peptidase [Yersinia phage PYps3T]|uniref:L-alanyl-D-glutamate peptidase n=1 Tax=Yersinia phage PYps3T TaxID=2801357 RepID=A0AAE7P745_9CAUD|nr:L-alanyl-D-glutamate peptidase [Yersinia phage PYps3T]QQO91024.1 L-alanyl-D-glutamate peptidase [Yersinia phage PYps3T]QQO91110.1 L-alanyl-D-glutamate peptidase [Yersinia phage PYps4T]QQO91280.1 L-alanyl-D-glutamate peptidase [Yersinia phage PYps16T]